jgi:hypothetical protein
MSITRSDRKKQHSFLLLLFGRFLCLLLLTRTTLLFPNHSPRKFPRHIYSGLGHNIQLHLHRHLTLSYIFHAFSNIFLQYSIPFKHTPAKVRAFQLVSKKRNKLRHTQKLLAGGPLHINESTYRLDVIRTYNTCPSIHISRETASGHTKCQTRGKVVFPRDVHAD